MTRFHTAIRIRCDNCGCVDDEDLGKLEGLPSGWAHRKYDFDDLCDRCIGAADKAARLALARIKRTGFDGPTGAE